MKSLPQIPPEFWKCPGELILVNGVRISLALYPWPRPASWIPGMPDPEVLLDFRMPGADSGEVLSLREVLFGEEGDLILFGETVAGAVYFEIETLVWPALREYGIYPYGIAS